MLNLALTIRDRAARALLVAPVLLAIAALAGCGGSKAAAKPTSIAASDLTTKNGTYWVQLTPDLKDELVDDAKSKLAAGRPDGASEIQAVEDSKLEAEIEKTYSNTSKRNEIIYAAYVEANDRLAQNKLNGALNNLDELCNEQPQPAGC